VNYKRLTKYYLLRFLRLATNPFPAAGGFACGTIVHFYPTSGFGLAFALSLAKITRTSCVASSLAWALTMPLFPIMLYCDFLTGNFVLRQTSHDIGRTIKNMATLHFANFMNIGKAFVIGSIINGLVGLVVLWFIGYLLLRRFRKQALKFVKKYL